MTKKFKLFIFLLVIFFTVNTVVYAAGNMSKVEKEWLDFYKALMEQRVKDGDVTKEQAKVKIKELEKQIKDSDEDIIYKKFTRKKVDAQEKRRDEKVRMMQERQERLIRLYASITSLSIDEVKTKCEQQDKTIWQLAYSEGVLNEFKEAVINDTAMRLKEKVENGVITQEKADKILADVTDHISKIGFDQ